MKNKEILDVACGGKMFYFDKNDPLYKLGGLKSEK